MKKKIICIIFLIAIFIQSIVNASVGECKFLRLDFNNKVLSTESENIIDIYSKQITTMKFYFEDNRNEDGYSRFSQALAVLKDSKGKILKHYGLTSYMISGALTNREFVVYQDFQMDEMYQKNKVYTLELYDKSNISLKGIEKSKPICSYKIKFADIIKEEQHIYDVVTQKCVCGATCSFEQKDTIGGNSRNIKEINDAYFSIESSQLHFKKNNEKYSGFDVYITSADGKKSSNFFIKFDDYYEMKENNNSTFESIIVEPSSYNNRYYYKLNKIPDIPKGKINVSVKIGDNEIYSEVLRNGSVIFEDLDKKHWAYYYISILADAGLINGYDNGTFLPNKKVTREEFITMFAKMNWSLDVGASANYYEYVDVLRNRWSYSECINYGYPLMESIGVQKYLYPANVVSREEIAKFLVVSLYLDGKEYTSAEIYNMKEQINSTLSIYEDFKQINEKYLPYVYTACKEGLMNGVSNSQFAPKEGITRAQAATLMHRIATTKANVIIETVEERKKAEKENEIKDANYTNEAFKENSDNTVELINPREEIFNSFDADSWYVARINNYSIYFYVSKDKKTITTYPKYDIENKSKVAYIYDRDSESIFVNLSSLYDSVAIYNYTIDKSKDYYTLKCVVDGKIYYSNVELDGSNYNNLKVKNMELFMLANANKIKDCEMYKFSYIELDAKNEWDKFYKENKNKTIRLGDNKEVQISIKNQNSFDISYNNNKSTINMTNNVNALKYDDVVHQLSSALGFSYLAHNNVKGLNLMCQKELVYLKDISATEVSELEFYAFILHYLNNYYEIETNKNNEEAKNVEILNFEDIITYYPPNSRFVSTTALVSSNNFSVEFNRKIKDIDVDVFNSEGESVFLSKSVVSKRNGVAPSANLDHKVLNIKIQFRPGESYTFELKNFVDIDGNRTKEDEKFTFVYEVPGEKAVKLNKNIKNITFNVPKNLSENSEIQVLLDGDLGPKQLIECYLWHEGNGATCYFRNGIFSIDYLKQVRNYSSLEFEKGDTIILEISIVDYSTGDKKVVLKDKVDILVP